MSKLTLILFLLFTNTFSYFTQTYDIYRVISYSNGIEVRSVSNTIKVPKKQLIYVPNAFSPDGDGINDLFYVKGNGLEHVTLEIYNRWGGMVFEAPHLSDRWDGTYRNQNCPMGTYVYQLKLDDKIIYSGTVVLVR